MIELGVYLAVATWALFMVHLIWLDRENARKWDSMETTTGQATLELWFENEIERGWIWVNRRSR